MVSGLVSADISPRGRCARATALRHALARKMSSPRTATRPQDGKAMDGQRDSEGPVIDATRAASKLYTCIEQHSKLEGSAMAQTSISFTAQQKVLSLQWGYNGIRI